MSNHIQLKQTKKKKRSIRNPDFSLRDELRYQMDVELMLQNVDSPSFVIDEKVLRRNAMLMHDIQLKTGAKIILALKAFSSFTSFPVLQPFLSGTTASSLHEAKLAKEEFGKEVHVYSPAYKTTEFAEMMNFSDHITFNSTSQLKQFLPQLKNCHKKIDIGLRINPEISLVKTELYNPCKPYSHFGVTKQEFDYSILNDIDGLHFHCLCGLNSDALERTLTHIEKHFHHALKAVKWVNFGGGHSITSPDYNVAHLCDLLKNFQKKYNVQVILEPGEAVVYQAGYLVAQVVDIMRNKKDIAILDTSATAHMPDIIEMPYRPHIASAGQPEEFDFTYRLAGATCLSGDIIGDFSFKAPLQIGQKLIFFDMAQYTMVKTTHFNGIQLPSIAKLTVDGSLETVKTFGYEMFKQRLS